MIFHPVMNKKLLVIIMALVLVSVGTAATFMFLYPYEPNNPPSVDDTGSTAEGINKVILANNQFAFDLYSKLSESESGNIFYSPYSISAALAMTYEGAKGKTYDEIKSVLHFPEPGSLRPNYAAIYTDINRKKDDYQLSTGNALWVQQDFTLLPDYISNVEKYYGGKATNVDFKLHAEESRQTINSFIEAQTMGRIKDLIPSGALDESVRLVITNAIYFKGTWVWEFKESETLERMFTVSADRVIKTPMMNMEPEKAMFNYMMNDDLQIIELPYKGDKLSMLILLPKDDLSSIESSLTVEKLSELKSQMVETHLEYIRIPKFEFDTDYSLNEALIALGMPEAFSPGADFSGMDGARDLFIGVVIHKAFVKVDEKGTEAAAATAIVMKTTSLREENIFNADHPFIFIIQEKESGNILFMGRVVDPSE